MPPCRTLQVEVVTVVGDAATHAVPGFSLDRVVAVENAQCLPVCRALEHRHPLGLQMLAVLVGLVRAAQHWQHVMTPLRWQATRCAMTVQLCLISPQKVDVPVYLECVDQVRRAHTRSRR